MVAIKAHQAQSYLNPPGPKVPAVLFYGTDAGLISERATKLAALIAARDSGEIIRLDDADLDNDPDHLAVELQTIPMFGGSKVVRVTAGRRITAAALQPLLEGGTLAATLIVEAGNLKPTDSMRVLFEKSAQAAAVACYADEARDIEGLIGETLKAHGLAITSDAREMLVARMGADRVMSRGEIEKLALYAAGKTEVDAADVDAIVGDASELAIDRTLNAAASGDAGPRGHRVRPRRCRRREPARRSSSPCSATCSACIVSAPISTPAPRSRTSSASSGRPSISSRRTPSACSAACGRRRGSPGPWRAPRRRPRLPALRRHWKRRLRRSCSSRWPVRRAPPPAGA